MDFPQLEWQEDRLLVRAPAKINLSLLIAGKRPDGYHEIDTVMAKVDWYDELLFEPSPQKGVNLVCTGPNWAPEGPENHVFTACTRLLADFGPDSGVTVTLNKLIPAGTGLGSASSDAAAALIGLNEFVKLRLSPANLSEYAAGIGSDVAFFVGGPLARCTGRGENISDIPTNYSFSAILVLPNVSVSTKKVYALYEHNPQQYSSLRATIAPLLAAARIDALAAMGVNMLEEACFALQGELRELKRALTNLGIGPVCLSGSGSAIYVLIEDDDDVKCNHYQQLIQKRTGCTSVVVHNNRW